MTPHVGQLVRWDGRLWTVSQLHPGYWCSLVASRWVGPQPDHSGPWAFERRFALVTTLQSP